VPTCPGQAAEVMVGLIHKFKRDIYGCAAVVGIISFIHTNIMSGLIAGFWYFVTVILFRVLFDSDPDEILK
jgi:hypothetical protein